MCLALSCTERNQQGLQLARAKCQVNKVPKAIQPMLGLLPVRVLGGFQGIEEDFMGPEAVERVRGMSKENSLGAPDNFEGQRKSRYA